MLVAFRIFISLPLNVDVQQSRALLFLLVTNLASNDLTLLERIRLLLTVINERNTLLPMGLRTMRSGGECNSSLLLHLRRGGILRESGVSRGHEEDIEPDGPSIESVDVLIERHLEIFHEGQFVDGDGMQRKRQEYGRVCRDGAWLDVANESLVIDVQQHAGHFEAIDIVPEGDVRSNEVRIRERSNSQRGMRRNHQTIGGEVTIPSIDDRIKHGLKEQSVAHPLGNDDVDLLNRQCDFFNLAPNAAVASLVWDNYIND